ncbi:NAD(P)H-hydrate epimerase [Ideonella livida]|uniref:ADP-dependent (S)-NAD(P)H-hydrate dehydratase n=1 Tax=Ideonella livida TaxID=2707176 RepID=A0A7C9PG85_9BURK|nr:NAD(P)H-hydrate epimerase [Ideonella livida]NDY90692.1 NAD(P)H-hydrate epimerase [Ideonella livida]
MPPHRLEASDAALSTALHRLLPPDHDLPLTSTAQARRVEQAARDTLPAFTLLPHAGLMVARWIRALHPHASRIWVICGPGHNGGDGLVAASWLQRWGAQVEVSLLAAAEQLPPEAGQALAVARQAGVQIHQDPTPRHRPMLTVDALLGLGQRRAPEGAMACALRWAAKGRQHGVSVLAVDLPTGLHDETGQPTGGLPGGADATLCLLTLKPGLFTGQGRDWAGALWWAPLLPPEHPAWQKAEGSLRLSGRTARQRALAPRQHHQHKGSFGDVWVLGGAPGMQGAAMLAAGAALHAGAGRVYWCPPGAGGLAPAAPSPWPALMTRPPGAWQSSGVLEHGVTVCGCGAGTDLQTDLAEILLRAQRLVLDADALNLIAAHPELPGLTRSRAGRGQVTVATPHPLEAARLLQTSTALVAQNRVQAARDLAQTLACAVVLKGSGSVVATPSAAWDPSTAEQAAPPPPPTWINPTGHARLATAGSGDVLAGWLGGLWSSLPATTHPLADVTDSRLPSAAPLPRCEPAWEAALAACLLAVWWHGRAAEPRQDSPTQTAGHGARRVEDFLPLPAQDLISAMTRVSP